MSQFVQRRDIDFLLHEVFDLETLLDAPHYRESISAILDSAETVVGSGDILPRAAGRRTLRSVVVGATDRA